MRFRILVLLICAVGFVGADCNPVLRDVLLIPPQPDQRSVQLWLSSGVASTLDHPAYEDPSVVQLVAGYEWRDLGVVTEPVCVEVNGLIARQFGWLCREDDGACIRVTTEQGSWTADDCPS